MGNRGGSRETLILPPPLQRGSKRTSMTPSTSIGTAFRDAAIAPLSAPFPHQTSRAASHLASPADAQRETNKTRMRRDQTRKKENKMHLNPMNSFHTNRQDRAVSKNIHRNSPTWQRRILSSTKVFPYVPLFTNFSGEGATASPVAFVVGCCCCC